MKKTEIRVWIVVPGVEVSLVSQDVELLPDFAQELAKSSVKSCSKMVKAFTSLF